jgi:hypothetical protein
MLSERVAAATSDGRFAVVLGGDCSIVLVCLLGARQPARGSVGLAYFDAHADFGTPEESRTGSVASMCLALAVGRGERPSARLAGDEPLVHGKDVLTTLRQLWDLKVMISTEISGHLLNGVQSCLNHQPTKIGESELLTLRAPVH